MYSGPISAHFSWIMVPKSLHQKMLGNHHFRPLTNGCFLGTRYNLGCPPSQDASGIHEGL